MNHLLCCTDVRFSPSFKKKKKKRRKKRKKEKAIQPLDGTDPDRVEVPSQGDSNARSILTSSLHSGVTKESARGCPRICEVRVVID